MQEAILTRLQSQCSFPLAWGGLGAGVATPRAALYRASGTEDYTMQGPGILNARVQIDCYGKTYKEAETAARDVKTALSGYRDGDILGCFYESVRDTNTDDAELLFRVSLTFTIHYRD